MELVVDCRESSLMEHLKEKDFLFTSKNLELGDLIILKDQQPLLMIERKTVRDLVASLKDGRYHNQRQRWKDFLLMYPSCRVALWIEGDLLGSYEVDETTKSSLVNSLLRLQSKHGILVFQIRSTSQFVQSLRMVFDKLEKDSTHLCLNPTTTDSSQSLQLKSFKKTNNVTPDLVWKNTLALLPGISLTTAEKIVLVFPTMRSLLTDEEASNKLESVVVGGRRLGSKTAQKILQLLCV